MKREKGGGNYAITLYSKKLKWFFKKISTIYPLFSISEYLY